MGKQNPIRQGLAVSVILLFIGMCVVPSTALQELKEKTLPINFDGNTLYVGGSGPNNYTTIQSAINDASDGDTVFVYDDSSPYYENLEIFKTIKVTGENKETTIIDGQNTGDVVYISSDSVQLSGFTITNSGSQGFTNHDDAGIDLASDNNIITDNKIISNGKYGILTDSPGRGKYNQISTNIITNNSDGIFMMFPKYNVFRNNSICNNSGYGLRLRGLGCIHNEIIDNDIIFNGNDGVSINDGSFNVIQGNLIDSNENGMRIIWDSDSNRIINNHVKNNRHYGMYLSREFKNCFISGNIIEENMLSGILISGPTNSSVVNNSFIHNGLILESFQDNIISGNTVNDKPLIYLANEQDIIIDDAGQVILYECDGITVQNCNISYADRGITLWNSNKCSILNNQINENKKNGLYIIDSHNSLVSGNNIKRNGPVEWEYLACGVYLNGGSLNRFIKNRVIENTPYAMILSSSNNILRENTFSSDGIIGILLENAFDNLFVWNDFLNKTHAAFLIYDSDRLGLHANTWLNNYWGRPRLMPKMIFGLKLLYVGDDYFPIIIPIPLFDYDLRPALLPHDRGNT